MAAKRTDWKTRWNSSYDVFVRLCKIKLAGERSIMQRKAYHTTLPVLASALDPRFKSLAFLPSNLRPQTYEALKEKLVEWNIDKITNDTVRADAACPIASNIAQATASTSSDTTSTRNPFTLFSFMAQSAGATHIQDDYDTVRPDVNAHISHFMTVPALAATEDPLLWWRSQKQNYPSLKIGVHKLFCISATSAPVERVFSTAGNIVNKLRSSLLPENVDMLVFMYKNKHLV